MLLTVLSHKTCLQSPNTLQQKLVSKITSAMQVHIASSKSSLQICWRELLTLNGTSGGTTKLKMLVRRLLRMGFIA